MNKIKKKSRFIKIKAAACIILMIAVILSASTIQSVEDKTIDSFLANDEDSLNKSLSEPGFREYLIEDNRLIYKTIFSKPYVSKYDVDDEIFSMISMPNTINIGFKAGSPVFPVFPLKILLPPQK